MTEPMSDPTPDDPSSPPGAAAPPALAYLPVVAAASAAALLSGGVLFAFANGGARTLSSTDRFRLLGQAANPFIAFVALSALVMVLTRLMPGAGGPRAPRATVTVATVVCVAVTLLAVNGILTDVTSGASALFQLSAVVSRLGTIVLSGLGLWLAASVKPAPPRRDIRD